MNEARVPEPAELLDLVQDALLGFGGMLERCVKFARIFLEGRKPPRHRPCDLRPATCDLPLRDLSHPAHHALPTSHSSIPRSISRRANERMLFAAISVRQRSSTPSA